MIRATIDVNEPDDLIKVYNTIKGHYKIIRIKNKLNCPLKLIHLNIIY